MLRDSPLRDSALRAQLLRDQLPCYSPRQACTDLPFICSKQYKAVMVVTPRTYRLHLNRDDV